MPKREGEGGGKEGMGLVSEYDIWKQIDDAERCLVGNMFEDAAALASSIVRNIQTAQLEHVVDDIQLVEMTEAAGMVLIQSLKELGRISQLFVELKEVYGSVAAIPVQIFLTGASMQITEGFTSNLGAIFEDYLAKWKCTNGGIYILTEEGEEDCRCIRQCVLSTEDYLDVAELYTITLLGMVLNETELAISWTEGAELREEDRQDLLRRLYSLQSTANHRSSAGLAEKQATKESHPSSAINASKVEEYPKTIQPHFLSSGDKLKAGPIKSLHPSIRRIDPCFWWFRTVRIKFGRVQLVLPGAKLLLIVSLIFSAYYILRKRGIILKRLVSRQLLSLRKALVDAWGLAFSIQMNPLAAVQQLPSAPQRSWASRIVKQ
ncbi:protein APEM9-like isoform X2 [Ananas comosus]|uniref:Protein APEM9-like isoform X2 n=2 Tax=Ananas comosus TaxID=4615 RepID=A0A6P5F4U3_ANACO|nr:protein APEM9-like isoform X2 [Ananas comosus]